MNVIRKAAVSGVFYPARPDILRSELSQLFTHVAQKSAAGDPSFVPKAIIAPHAGYMYSGPIAATAYATLRAAANTIHRVVLLGPAHRVNVRGLAVSSAQAFETPLGLVPIDLAGVERVLEFPQVCVMDEAHQLEHCIEVQLPFLQYLLQDFKVVPLVAGHATTAEVSEVIDAVWGGSETLIVISSDLSHYHDYNTAQAMDQATSHAIETLNSANLDSASACGFIPVTGLLAAARKHHLSARTLDLRNSGDTAGTKEKVVGYGAYAFH